MPDGRGRLTSTGLPSSVTRLVGSSPTASSMSMRSGSIRLPSAGLARWRCRALGKSGRPESAIAVLTGRPFDLAAMQRPSILFYVGDQDLADEWLERREALDHLGLTRLERSQSLHRAWL